MESEGEDEAVGGTPFNGSSSSSSSGRNTPVEFSEAHGSPLRFSPKAFGKHSPVAASSLMHSPLSKSIPNFDNGDIENYLRTFEKAVVMNNIPKEQWANLLFPQLSLKGREVFQALDL